MAETVHLFDAFLKLDGIKGESADHKHKGDIDVLNFGWGMSQTGSQATGGGGGTGRVQVHDLCVIKNTDVSSPLLMLRCADGTHIKEATLTVRKAGGEQLEYLKIKLTDVLISGIKPWHTGGGSLGAESTGGLRKRPDGSGGGNLGLDEWTTEFHDSWRQNLTSSDETPMEFLSLNFSKVEMTYQTQGADGKAKGGPILAGWDVKANQKI